MSTSSVPLTKFAVPQSTTFNLLGNSNDVSGGSVLHLAVFINSLLFPPSSSLPPLSLSLVVMPIFVTV
jgi:hypothetical protein